MGCCVSKYRPKKCCLEDAFSNHVQDKLVISKTLTLTPTPTPTPLALSNKISPFPLSPTISNTSSASLLTSRDRSFSNEFLWACVKENPHIIHINSIKEASLALSTTKSPSQRLQSPVKPLQRDHKRGRSTFTPSTHTLNSTSHYLPNRSLRSPSPSRRFNGGDNSNGRGRGILAATTCTSSSNRIVDVDVDVDVAPKINALNSVSSSLSLRKDHNFRPPTPLNPSLNRETFVHRITSKIDERALRAAMSTHQGNDSFTVEDIKNPLISLDCFIFL